MALFVRGRPVCLGTAALIIPYCALDIDPQEILAAQPDSPQIQVISQSCEFGLTALSRLLTG
jgi:hypothetical protein